MESKKTLQYVLIGLALVVALVGSYFGVSLPVPEIPAPDLSGVEARIAELETQNARIEADAALLGGEALSFAAGPSKTNFAWVVASQVTAKNSLETDTIAEYGTGNGVTIDGMLLQDGGIGEDVAVAGAVTASGALNAGTTLNLDAQTTLTVTNGAPFTPTGTHQPIVAASAVTPTIAIGESGDVLIVRNTGTNAITIVDTGTTKLGGSRALGQYDTLVLISDGTNWLELAYVNN